MTGLPIVLAGNPRLNNELNHTFMAGFRYAFGIAPAVRPGPPPALAQPMAMSRCYLVFFDWDKSELGDRAREIVADAR